jgi:hypothetical protein
MVTAITKFRGILLQFLYVQRVALCVYGEEPKRCLRKVMIEGVATYQIIYVLSRGHNNSFEPVKGLYQAQAGSLCCTMASSLPPRRHFERMVTQNGSRVTTNGAQYAQRRRESGGRGW